MDEKRFARFALFAFAAFAAWLFALPAFVSAAAVAEDVCPLQDLCVIDGYAPVRGSAGELAAPAPIPTPTPAPSRAARLKNVAGVFDSTGPVVPDDALRNSVPRSPSAVRPSVPSLNRAGGVSSYGALRDESLVVSKVKWQRAAYERCLDHLTEIEEAANAECGTTYKGVDIVLGTIVLAYTESHCGKGKVFLGVKGKTGDAATQIRAAVHLQCVGLDGKGPYAGCNGDYYCVLSRYTPEGVEGNEYGYNAMRINKINALQQVLGVGSSVA
jgi:hypothetical protein